VVGNQVTIHGVGRDDHGPLVPFRVDASDAHPDALRIVWPGYAAEGTVRGDRGIRIRSECGGRGRAKASPPPSNRSR
jgi:hypothetical protein